MIDPKLLSFVREELSAGKEAGEVERAAAEAGWSVEDTAAALEALRSDTPWVAVSGGAVPGAPANSWERYSPSAARTVHEKKEKGLIGLVMRLGLAQDARQANLVLVGVLLATLALIVWINWPRGAPEPSAPSASEQQL